MSPQIAWREIKGDGRLDLPMTSSFSPLRLPSTSSGLYLPPHVWPLHTQLNLPLKVEMDPELLVCANRSEGQWHMGSGQV